MNFGNQINFLIKKTHFYQARVARELSDADIYLCEVIMENVLRDLEPAEIAALLSVKKNSNNHSESKNKNFLNIFFLNE